MPLTLMYITNKPDIAKIAEDAGVDRIWIDLEQIGKEERQAGLNTVKSYHSIDDIIPVKSVLSSSELLVRLNPFFEGTKNEVENVIRNGADAIMLPMFKTKQEVDKFVEYVNGRAKVVLLLETKEAAESIDVILQSTGIDEVHIGLNDLHLAYNKRFMFELLIDGTVERLCKILKDKGYLYGFGGIARVGFGAIPAEYIITEHYRLGSSMAILSRSFCDANIVENPFEVADIFKKGINNIRKKEMEASQYTTTQFEFNYQILQQKINNVAFALNR
ncbi:aldolase/citrate lyase family protein [Neobacillus sp. SAB-20_R2A]|uniref:aldolase/citrate lyase family protein n=1 Tax=Neobacillus sp. SAB-20_R2A TaxID=3120519 RepID=UPI003C6E86C0